MGSIVSLLGATIAAIEKRTEKRKAKKGRKHGGAASTEGDTGLEPAISRGLVEEHLATSPPPIPEGRRGEEQSGGTGTATLTPQEQPPTLTTTTTTSPPTKATNSQPTLSQPNKPPNAKMATDEDYMAFLDKANQDPNEGYPKTQSVASGTQFTAMDDGADVPAVLKTATRDAWYTSEADEKFEVVCLGLGAAKGGLPDEATFARLIHHPSPNNAEVTIMDIAEWDSRGEYKHIVDAVREASKGSDVRVYRVKKTGTRVEYWVVGTEGGRLVGVKALAVES